MARSTPRTWVYNELVTALIMNGHVRDQLNAYWPYTTAGDIAYASAADTVARLGIGTAGEVLRTNAGETAAERGGLLNALISDATSRAIATSSLTEATLTVEDVDIDGFVADPVANKITIPANFDGSYLHIYRVEYASNSTGFRALNWYYDGASPATSAVRIPAVNGDTTVVWGSVTRNVVAGGVITMKTWQNSGGALNVINAELGMVRL